MRRQLPSSGTNTDRRSRTEPPSSAAADRKLAVMAWMSSQPASGRVSSTRYLVGRCSFANASMPARLRAAGPTVNRGNPQCFGGLDLAFAREAPDQLGARADAELGVRLGQVRLDGSNRHVQRRRDLLVREALRDELHDALLGRRQLAAAARAA